MKFHISESCRIICAKYNLPLIMKLTLVLMISALLQVSAGTHAQKINLHEKNASLQSVLKKIRKQSGYDFFFDARLVRHVDGINISISNATIEEALSLCFEDQPLTYTIENEIVVIKEREKRPVKQAHSLPVSAIDTLRGKVTDTTGAPLPGVSVMIKGTREGASTDLDGNFTLYRTPDDGVLVFSLLGFSPLEVPVSGRSAITVALSVVQDELEEVIVMGYGVQKKINLTGAVGSIDGGQIENMPVSNLSNAIAGRIPGMTVTSTTGRPGATSSIRIRGLGTWNNTSPLYVIDGVVRDQEAFDGIDPSEIETINVLKDAASSAIYGARAANGVILVSTKRGRIQKPVFSYKALVGTEEFTRVLDKPSAYESAIYANEGWMNQGETEDYAGIYTPDELELLKTDAYDIDWFDLVHNTPVIQQHNLSVNGGSETIRYFFSAGIYDATGIIKNLDYKRNNIRANVEASISKNLSISVNLDANLRNEKKYYWNNDNNALHDTYKALYEVNFTMLPYDANGYPDGTFYHIHPAEVVNSGSYRRDRDNSYNALVALDYKVPFVEGLKLRAAYSKNTGEDFTKTRYNHMMLYVHQTTGAHNHLTTDEILEERLIQRSPYEFIEQRNDSRSSYQANLQLNYTRSFKNHGVDAVLAYEQSESNTQWFGGKVEEFYTKAIDQMFAGSNDPARRTINGSASEIGRQSLVGRVNYNYLSKYILEFSFRYDGSVVFAPSNRWGFFPSASAAWRISEEPFMKRLSALDNLKLRASIGNLGNDAVGTYQWLQQYNFANGAVFGTPSKGIQAGTFPNENITWEKSTTYNIGLEGELWQGQLSFDLDYFYRHSYDILRSRVRTIPGTFGAGLPFENYAEIDNRGIEVTLGHRNSVGKVNYYLQGNLGFAREKVVKIDVAANQREYQNPIGHPLNTLWGYESAGIIKTQEQLDALPDGFTIFGRTPELGMLIYKDIRGASSDEPDGIVDGNDQVPVSRRIDPRVNFGISTGVSWEKLSLDVLFQGVAGKDALLSPRNQRLFKTPWPWFMDRWSPANPDGTAPRAIDARRDRQDYASDYWLRNAAFLRLKNLRITYDASGNFLRKIGINELKVFLNGTNLFVLDHIKYYDPEIEQGNAYPLTRNYSLGLNISF